MQKKINNKNDYENYELSDDTCDLDLNKICNSCGKCIETDKNYEIIKITKIFSEE